MSLALLTRLSDLSFLSLSLPGGSEDADIMQHVYRLTGLKGLAVDSQTAYEHGVLLPLTQLTQLTYLGCWTGSLNGHFLPMDRVTGRNLLTVSLGVDYVDGCSLVGALHCLWIL